MKFIHKEGIPTILITLFCILFVQMIFSFIFKEWAWVVSIPLFVLFLFVLQFFRNPNRTISSPDPSIVYAPADGKVVVIEEVQEAEYFKENRVQISIFMSPLNVHVNRAPIGGTIIHKAYFPGTYLPAWNPKSSTQNERATTVIQNEKLSILVRQIAGAMARRIVNFTKLNQIIEQGQEIGFIKFGSRVDIFLPKDAIIKVKIGDQVKGNLDILATLS